MNLALSRSSPRSRSNDDSWWSTRRPRRYRLKHPLIGEVVVQNATPTERHRLHRSVADQLRRERGEPDAERAAAIAHHFDRAGDVVEGLPASIAAAEAAERVFAYREASRQWGRAIEQFDAIAASRAPAVDLNGLLERGAIAADRAGESDERDRP